MNGLDETHGIHFELVRHFLGRIFDSDMFSSRGQWRTVAISAFALAIPAGLLLLDPPYAHPGVRIPPPGVADELAVLTLLMSITGVLALLSWQSLYPSRRDFLALASFPARPRQIFLARFVSMLIFAIVMVLAISFLPSIIPPHFFTAPSSDSFAARAIPAVLGCLFIFLAIVALQGVLLNVAPGRLFVPATTCVQGALVAVFFLAGLYSWFIVDWKPETVARLPEFASWAPPVWFAGLHQALSGDRDPFFAAMASRGLAAVAAAAALSALLYLVSYRRYRKLLLENPDSARALWSFGAIRLVAGGPRQEAIIQFIATVLTRSRTHRLVLMAYAGAALGIMINSALLTGIRHGAQGVLQFAVLYWPLGTSFVMLSGIRHVFSLPADLSSNWLFQITESQGRREWMPAIERFVVAAIIVPIYLISTPIAASVLDWPIALRMAALQFLASLTAFDLLFYEWQQLPFTCSYVPGKRPLMMLVASWLAILGVVTPVLTIVISTVARMPELFLIYGAFIAGDWIWARRRRMEGWGESRLIYRDVFGSVASLGIKDMTYRAAAAERPADEPVRPPDPPEIPEPPPALWLRLKALAHPGQFDRDLDDELQFHLEMSGPERFGNVAQVKEDCRELWTFAWFETVWQDLRYGFGQLRRAPVFTAVAAITLALGIAESDAGAAGGVMAWLPVAIWLYLLLARRWFWRISVFEAAGALPSDVVRIAVVIPARDEAASIQRVVGCWDAQQYNGPLRVFIVDDHSSDGTADIARRAMGGSARFELLSAPEKPQGWTGKLWAVSRGVEAARDFAPDYYLFTDADIVHPPETLRALMACAARGGYDMVSLMVRLHCSSLAERALIPAFVFFFFLLYPPGPKTNGAAGGCMLIRRSALERAGGIEGIREALIDDCALAAAVKRSGGRIYLAPAESSESLRAYRTFGEIRNMISRTAFTQLRYSVVLLMCTLAGLLVTFVLPVGLALLGHGTNRVAGAAAWLLMSAAYLPTVRYYRISPAWSAALPAIALIYAYATMESAIRYWQGRGGEWKGRYSN